LGAAQQQGDFEVARIGLARERDLHVAVDNKFQEQVGEALPDDLLVAQQDRPQLRMAPSVERGTGEQLHQRAAGVEGKFAAVADEQGGRRGRVFLGDGFLFRQVHQLVP
jgi:hypothetical protein